MNWSPPWTLALPLSLLLLGTPRAPANASKIKVTSQTQAIVYQQGDAQDPVATLQLENVAADTDAEVLIWQLGLSLMPSSDAVGTVGFQAATEPADYLFSSESPPLAIPSLPQAPAPTAIEVSAALIFDPQGVPISVGQSRNIVDLHFEISPDAAGSFELLLAPFSNSAIGGSSWASQFILNPMDAFEFENAKFGSSAAARVLATIEVFPVPEPATLTMLVCLWTCLTVTRKTRSRRG